jgi:hypothetical protein
MQPLVATLALLTAVSTASADKLTRANLAKMVRLGVTEDVILMAARASGMDFPLNASTIVALHRAGVPTSLLDKLMGLNGHAPAKCDGPQAQGAPSRPAARAEPVRAARARGEPGGDPWRQADAEIEAERRRRLEARRFEEERRRGQEEAERRRSEERRRKRDAELRSEERR